MKGLLFYCCRSAIVKCMLCHGGSGIDWVVVIVVILMVVIAVLRMEAMIRKNLYMCMLGGGICSVGSGGDVRSC